MKGSFNTFFEDQEEITWCTVRYEIDAFSEPEMYHLSVHTYSSGDITEYIPQRWLDKFEEIAWVYYKEGRDRFDHFYEQTSDYHNGEKIAAAYIVKMMNAGYSNDKIIDELVNVVDSIYLKFKELLTVS